MRERCVDKPGGIALKPDEPVRFAGWVGLKPVRGGNLPDWNCT